MSRCVPSVTSGWLLNTSLLTCFPWHQMLSPFTHHPTITLSFHHSCILRDSSTFSCDSITIISFLHQTSHLTDIYTDSWHYCRWLNLRPLKYDLKYGDTNIEIYIQYIAIVYWFYLSYEHSREGESGETERWARIIWGIECGEVVEIWKYIYGHGFGSKEL